MKLSDKVIILYDNDEIDMLEIGAEGQEVVKASDVALIWKLINDSNESSKNQLKGILSNDMNVSNNTIEIYTSGLLEKIGDFSQFLEEPKEKPKLVSGHLMSEPLDKEQQDKYKNMFNNIGKEAKKDE